MRVGCDGPGPPRASHATARRAIESSRAENTSPPSHQMQPARGTGPPSVRCGEAGVGMRVHEVLYLQGAKGRGRSCTVSWRGAFPSVWSRMERGARHATVIHMQSGHACESVSRHSRPQNGGSKARARHTASMCDCELACCVGCRRRTSVKTPKIEFRTHVTTHVARARGPAVRSGVGPPSDLTVTRSRTARRGAVRCCAPRWLLRVSVCDTVHQ